MSRFEMDELNARLKKKRIRVKKACTNCRNAKSCCSTFRPCDRCIRLGIQQTCIDKSDVTRQQLASDRATLVEYLQRFSGFAAANQLQAPLENITYSMSVNLDRENRQPESPQHTSSSSDSSPPNFPSYDEHGESKSSESFDFCYPAPLSRTGSNNSINSNSSINSIPSTTSSTSSFSDPTRLAEPPANQLLRLKEENERLKATLNSLYFEMHNHGDIQHNWKFHSRFGGMGGQGLLRSVFLFPTSMLYDFNGTFLDSLPVALRTKAITRQMTCKDLFLPHHVPKCLRIISWLSKGFVSEMEIEQLWNYPGREVPVRSLVRLYFNEENSPVRMEMISQLRPEDPVPNQDDPEYGRFFQPLNVPSEGLRHLLEMAEQVGAPAQGRLYQETDPLLSEGDLSFSNQMPSSSSSSSSASSCFSSPAASSTFSFSSPSSSSSSISSSSGYGEAPVQFSGRPNFSYTAELGEEFSTSQCGVLRNSEEPELLEVTRGVELPGLRVGPLSSFLDVLLNEPPGDSAAEPSLLSSSAHELQGTRSTGPDVSAYM